MGHALWKKKDGLCGVKSPKKRSRTKAEEEGKKSWSCCLRGGRSGRDGGGGREAGEAGTLGVTLWKLILISV